MVARQALFGQQTGSSSSRSRKMIIGQTPFGAAPLAGGDSEWIREPFGVITLSILAAQDAAAFSTPAGAIAVSGYVGTPLCVAFAPEPGEMELSGYAGTPLNTRFDPPLLWPNYTSDGTNITIPIADLEGLTAEEADAATGDWRKILQAFLLSAVTYHRSFVWSDQPRTYSAFSAEFERVPTLVRRFLIAFHTTLSEANVAQEP
jgi:hypothetical protein